MARYIDADKLSIYFNALAEHAEMEGLQNMAHIHRRCLQRIAEEPTADVVPKSEVEELKSENERLIDLVNELQEYNEAWVEDNGKQRKENKNLVREIFAEIEQKIEREVRFYKSVYDACEDKSLSDKAYGRVLASGKIHDFIIELKKKYTGDQT